MKLQSKALGVQALETVRRSRFRGSYNRVDLKTARIRICIRRFKFIVAFAWRRVLRA